MRVAYSITSTIVGILALLFLILTSSITSADVIDDVSIAVPVSCSFIGLADTPHTASINAGTYTSDIGTTNFKVTCNDGSGYALYAIGYSNEEYGNTKMLATINNELAPAYNINTGTAISGANSAWAMKLIPVTTASSGTTQPYTPTIESDADGSYSNYHVVPAEYTKVATFTSNTDFVIGSNLQSTYQVYIDNTKPAGTYAGKVKYTLVHPNDAHAPVALPATLDTGKMVNVKLKSLAATVVNGKETTITPEFDPNGESDLYDAYDEYIKSINVHLKTSAPSGFTPTEANTISSSASVKPIYIVFDNANDAGVMHFYTEGEQIFLPADSSFMFYMLFELSEISGISDWDTSNVTDMGRMFNYTGYSATTFVLDLSSWDISNVTNTSYMFACAGYSATTFALDLSSWNTTSVTNMSYMFGSAGHIATTWSIGDLSAWNTSNVTNISGMFSVVGQHAATWSIGDLSSWDTSSVTDMSYMFSNAGDYATTWSIGDLSSWNVSNVVRTDSLFYRAGASATTWSIGDLSSWDTSSVTDMSSMFRGAGASATTWSIGDLSSWDTSSVIKMNYMFRDAGSSATTFTLNLSYWDTSNVEGMTDMLRDAGLSATTWSVTIPQTNGNNISNTTNRIYGKTTSVYATPPSGKSFTLAQS